MSLPVWHPLLRTASLLRGGPRLAADLATLVDGLAEAPRTTSPREVVALVAADLWQLCAELEIFEELPHQRRWEAFRETRGHLARLTREMDHRPGADDSLDPLRALAALRMGEGTRATLGRVGAHLAVHFEEHTPEPRLAEPAHASSIGACCDLAYLATVLRQQREHSDGHLRSKVTTWAQILEREAEVLRMVVPPREEEDFEITKTEIPVPRGEGRPV
jgi:hypothetical protein